MNKLNKETKHGANDTQFYNWSFIQHKHRECKKDRVGHKTCVSSSRYIISKCTLNN